MATLLDTTILAKAAYDSTNPTVPLPPNWVLDKTSPSNSFGYFGVSFKNTATGEVFIGHRGTEPSSLADLGADALLASGAYTPQNALALDFTSTVVLANPGAHFIVAGHSLGGNNTQTSVIQVLQLFSGQNIDITGVTFQSPGIPAFLATSASSFPIFNFRNVADPISVLAPGQAGTVMTINAGPPVSQYINGIWQDAVASVAPGSLGIFLNVPAGFANTALTAHSVDATIQYLQVHPGLANYPVDGLPNLIQNVGLRDSLGAITPAQYNALVQNGQVGNLWIATSPTQVQQVMSTLPIQLLATPSGLIDASPQTLTINSDGSFTLQNLNGDTLTWRDGTDGSVHVNWSRADGSNGTAVYYPDNSYTNLLNYSDGSSVATSFTPDPSGGSSGSFSQIFRNSDGSIVNPNDPVQNTISVSNPYDTSPTSATNPTDPTNVSGVESGQIAPGVSMDPSIVNGSVPYVSAEKGAIVGQYYMPGGERLSPTLLQDAQLLTWGNVFQDVSAGSSSSLIPVDPIVGAYSNALNLRAFGIDPLILDLNGDGVKLTSYQENLVLFDVDHDGGSKEQTGWVAANTITGGTPPAINTDGIVVQDLNSNGVIDNISETLSEYFNGTVGTNGDPGTKPFVNGFESLASSSLNTVADGVFNSSDAGWSTVRVWVDDNADGMSFKDVNGNGTYQAGIDQSELKTFAELGITSINLTPTAQSGLVNGGNEILATGSFVIGGQTWDAQAANFIANPDGHTFLNQQNGTNTGTKVMTQGETGAISSYVSHAANGEAMDAAVLGVNNLYGGAGNDTLIGDASGNWLAGGVGSDTFDAGAGDDMLMIDASDLQGNIHAGAGDDIAQIVGDLGVTLNLALAEVEIAQGGRGSDILIGGGRSSVFVRGGEGDDVIIGGAANDALSGEEGNDFVDGGAGNDLVRGGRGQDLLLGGAGDDIMDGGVEDDNLSGGDGNDVLKGSQGVDILDGGAGTDIAQFSGSFADYRITKLDSTTYRVVDTKAGRDGSDTLKNIEKLNFADVSSVDITLDNPIPVKDVITIADRNGAKLISVASLLGNDIDWQGDALHITTISDIKGGTIAGITGSEGTPTINGSGQLTFTPDPTFTGVMSFKYKIADVDGTPGATAIQVGTSISAEMRGQVFIKTPDMPTDSAFTDQWYLTDTNVIPVWKDYTGKGVKIGQFEPSGPYATTKEILDYRQTDLQANIDPYFLSDPNNVPVEDFSQHATLVAGVMVASRNGDGAVGVAYNATIAGWQIGDTVTVNSPTSVTGDFFNLYKLQDYDVSSNSWGLTGIFENFATSTPSIADEFFRPAVSWGHLFLGSNIVMAGGNSRQTGGNTNYSVLTNNRYVIVTGAINALGDISTLSISQAPFSNPGASILISAPGSNVASTSRIVMNDQGSVFGSDIANVQGTSFATPIVSGVIALMLEANFDLGYRDVQQILALSARKVNDNSTDLVYNAATNWNGGGMHVSHDYGFGDVDARAAVRLAETWYLPDWNSHHTTTNERHLSHAEGSLLSGGSDLGVTIADGSVVTRALSIGAGIRAEHVEITVDLTHSSWGDLTVELISPTGTVSKMVANPGATASNPLGDPGGGQLLYTFDTTHDYGELAQGNWQLRITDRAGRGTGMLNGWKVDVYGSDANETIASDSTFGETPVISATGDNVYFYTDEFATAPGTSRSTLNDTNSGTDIINASAVTTNSTINLNNGSTSTIAGRNLTVSGNVEFAFGGDGNDRLTGNALDNQLQGGRGVDTLIGGLGNDTYMVDNVDDVVTEQVNEGTDTVQSGIAYTLGANVENLILTGTGAIDGAGNELDNVLTGNSANNTLSGMGGNDTLGGGGGADMLIGGTGDDTYVINLGLATDTITIQDVSGVGEGNRLRFGDGITAGDLTFVQEVGALRIDVWANGNYVRLLNFDQTQQAGSLVTNIVEFADGTTANLLDLMNAASGANSITGTQTFDRLYGTGQRDTIQGLGADDFLDGRGGNDILLGGDGNDELVGSGGNDYLDGGNGDDVLWLEGDYGSIDGSNFAFSGTRVGGAGADVFKVKMGGGGSSGYALSGTQVSAYNMIGDFNPNQVGEAVDLFEMPWIHGFSDLSISSFIVNGISMTTVSATNGAESLNITMRGVDPSSLIADDFIFSFMPGMFIGSAGNDTLTGDAGGNTLDGGLGADTMTGRTGDDTYIVDNAGDVVNELPGGGFDTVKSSVTRTLEADVENLVLTGTGSINGTGNAQNNRLTGNSGNNVLDGGAGVDMLIGGAGNDTYIVDSESDSILEQVGGGITDTVQSSVSFTLGSEIENLTLTGTDNIDATGNALANVLTGNAGDNFLDGNGGADTLIGGAGNDTYLIDSTDSVTEQANEGTDTVYAGFNYTLGNNVENLVLLPSAATGTGNALDNLITGNASANTLTGNDGNDTLDGGAGNDTLVGGAGDDSYILDNSGDSITETAGNGVDTVVAGFTYSLAGTQLENLTLTGTGNINGTGNASDNVLIGNSGANALNSDGGNDTLDGGAGADTLTGGTGNDIYVIDNTGDVITEYANEGTDTVQSSITYLLGTNLENLTLTGFGAINGTGTSGNNVLIGNGNANTLTGLAGDDRLDGGAGADTLVGGTDNDTYVVDNAGDVVTELANEGTDTVESYISYTLGTNQENLTLVGSALVNGAGNSLNNVMTGNSGNNVLDGGAGVDTLIGGTGDDTYVVDSTGDVVTEQANEGIDTVQSSITYTLADKPNLENLTVTGNSVTGTGNSGNNVLSSLGIGNTLLGGLGDDTYMIGYYGETITEAANEGIDTVVYQGQSLYTLGSNLDNLTLTGNYDDETGAHPIGTGNALSNSMTGSNAGFSELHGGDGNDTLYGGASGTALYGDAGADVYHGGTGNDSLYVDAADLGTPSNIDGGAGFDWVYITMTTGINLDITSLMSIEGAAGGTGNDIIFTTGSGAVSFAGGAGNDSLTGGSGNDYLHGGAGADTLRGGAGDDTLYADSSDVVIDGGAGTDTVIMGYGGGALTLDMEQANIERFFSYSSANDNIFTAGSTAVYIDTGDGNDTLTGGSGNDTLNGGFGADVMAGNGGDDIYYVAYDATDTITENAGAGTDTVFAYNMSYTLGANLDNLTLLWSSSSVNGTGNALNNVLTGNSLANILSGGAGDDTLEGKGGNDTLVGDSGNDTYVFSRTDGQDTIQDSSGTSDKMQFTTSINPLDLILERSVNDLRISLYGSTDRVTIQNWYSGTTNQTETIQAGNGQQLLNTQVDQLIQAMASFSTQTGLTWEQGLAQQPQNVQAVLAASWQ